MNLTDVDDESDNGQETAREQLTEKEMSLLVLMRLRGSNQCCKLDETNTKQCFRSRLPNQRYVCNWHAYLAVRFKETEID